MSENQQNILFQERTRHGVNHLTLRDGRALKIKKIAKAKTVSYIIDIISLDSSSRRVYHISWGWLIAAVISLLLAVAAIKFPQLFFALQQDYSTGLTVLAVVSAVGCFIFCYLYSSRKQVFYSRHGQIPLFEIWPGKPTGKLFREYMKLLTESIQQVQEKSSLSNEQQLSGEMKMLRRLMDEKVINQQIYEKAKRHLFGKF